MTQYWNLQRDFEWQMAHALVNYEGPCSRCHGHSFKAFINVEFTQLNRSEMGMDFADLKKIEKWVDANWDHRCLVPYNHLILQPYIQGEDEWDPIINELGFVPVPFNPTCERLSEVLANVTSELLGVDVSRIAVTVNETSKNSCMYTSEQSMIYPVDIQAKVEEIGNLLRGINTDEEQFIG